MKDEKLIIPKGDGTLEMAIASLGIYYESNNWVSNEDFKLELIKKYPGFKDKDEAFLLHKARTARYFGLIEYLYKRTEELDGNQGKITESGKRFYEAFEAKNNLAMIDTIMDSINLYTFGRYNHGVQGDSDVEMPATILKAALDLDYITKDESVVLLYLMHDEEQSYEEAIAEIIRKRSIGGANLPDSMSSADKASINRRYGDNKAAQLMRELGIFINDTTKYELSADVKSKYDNYIQSLKAKIEKSDIIQPVRPLCFTSSNNVIQTIFFGPPGTGKSYNATKLVQTYHPDYGKKGVNCPYVYRTTIYPDYSYYDFIGNIMPTVKDKDITYDFKPGVFTKALCKALDVVEENIPVFLIVEEMSRGNIASIFGDIFQLLDRNEYGYSEYVVDHDIVAKYLHENEVEEYKPLDLGASKNDGYKKEIYLPPNFNIIGTVNTSDQNVFVIDTAFKRRFDFMYVDIEPAIDERTGDFLNQFTFILGDYNFEWNDFYQKLNKYLVIDLEMPEDKQIGQFFIKFDKKTEQENFEQLQNKLLQYLWEDIHLINITENRLFDKNYESFSSVYKAFKEHKNVFDSNFIERFKKSLDVKLELVAEREETYRIDKEV